jgi:hypothetical protein
MSEEFEGEFEVHITVRLDGARDLGSLQGWAAGRGLSCTHIVLEQGAVASQPMLNWRARGRLSEELAAAEAVGRQLAADGFEVRRIKVEAGPGNRGVPQTDADAGDEDRYFEHHVKLALAPDVELAALIALACEHGAHVSRNVLRVRDDARHERFVTQRCGAVGRTRARVMLEALLDALRRAGYEMLDVEEEFVVFDSNAEVDAGWIR